MDLSVSNHRSILSVRKIPVENEKAFVKRQKKLHILMVPGSSFACQGYVRLAYCVSYETIVNSLPKFQELTKKYF